MKTSEIPFRKLMLAICIATTLVITTSCGIKPENVDPPPEAENKVFPRTYPDITTDPQTRINTQDESEKAE